MPPAGEILQAVFCLQLIILFVWYIRQKQSYAQDLPLPITACKTSDMYPMHPLIKQNRAQVERGMSAARTYNSYASL